MNTFNFPQILSAANSEGLAASQKKLTGSLVLVAVFAALFPMATLHAQSVMSSVRPEESHANIEAYWSPSRILNATHIVANAKVGANNLPDAEPAPPATGAVVRAKGSAPAAIGTDMQKVIVPEAYRTNLKKLVTPNATVAPNSASTYGASFTTTRVFPDAAVTAYPFITAGKLYFSDSKTGIDYVCSASVLRQRIVVTAGHCVANASTVASRRYFYSNFYFIPAYTDGMAPVGAWTANKLWVGPDWYNSDGSVPNAQDVGMLVMNDQNGLKISDYTGYLGWSTGGLANDDVVMLGYPCNLDDCGKMQVNYAHTYAYGGNNTYVYGSAMKGGSSGGPWIKDFGVEPVSDNPNSDLGNNYLVGVTSYGPTNTGLMYQGASQFDSRFISLLNSACGAANSGNCN